MATMRVDGFEITEQRLGRMGKPMIRRIVEAGAAAADRVMRENIEERHHVRTGDMLESVGMNEYREILGGGSVDVYPQGDDRHGARNATKAYVINYGRGGTKRRGKMGDRFITAPGQSLKTEQAVKEAMQAESDRLIDEINS